MLDLIKAKDVLRIDTEDTYNDGTIQAILDSFPAWLETHTGLSELRQRDNKVVEQLQGLWLRKMYFSYDDVRVDRAIESLLRTVSLMATMSEKEYQDAVFTANGQYKAADFGADAWQSVTVAIPEPVTMSRTITANGEYCCSDETAGEAVGYDTVVVDVKPKVEPLLVTSSGKFVANQSGLDGYDEVLVDVKPEAIVDALEARENGLYELPEGLDGWNIVHVNVPETELEPLAISANGTYEPESGKGFSSVSVNVSSSEAVLIDQTFTAEGTYNAVDDGADGYRSVTISLPSDGVDWEQVYADRLAGGIGRPVFPEGITTINEYAFYYCTNYTALTIPDTVTTIGSYAFNKCKSMKGTLVIPDSLVIPANIGGYDFSSIFAETGFTQVVFGAGMKAIPYALFSSGSISGDVEIPAQIEAIHNYAFAYCSGINNVIIRNPNAVVTLGGTSAFTSSKPVAGTGYFYVPDELVNSYKTATNWSAYANQIKPLSEYTGGAA